MKIRIKTKEGKNISAYVEELPTLLKMPVGNTEFFLFRTGWKEYRQLEAWEAEILIAYFNQPGREKLARTVTMTEVEKLLSNDALRARYEDAKPRKLVDSRDFDLAARSRALHNVLLRENAASGESVEEHRERLLLGGEEIVVLSKEDIE